MAAKKKAKKSKAKATKKVQKRGSLSKAFTKSELYSTLSESTGLGKKEITAVFEELGSVIEQHVRKRSVGTFTLPGLLKIKTVRKPATKARKGINPFTGEETVFKAKPARTVVKIQALKALKTMVE